MCGIHDIIDGAHAFLQQHMHMHVTWITSSMAGCQVWRHSVLRNLLTPRCHHVIQAFYRRSMYPRKCCTASQPIMDPDTDSTRLILKPN